MIDRDFKARIEDVKARIKKSAEKAGKRYDDITVVCATKGRDIDTIEDIAGYGFTIIGENRVQELLGKYKPAGGLEWQFIGQLQTNKVKYIADKVNLIQSVDRLGLAQAIDRECAKIGKIMPVLAEVNISGIEGRGGVSGENLIGFVNEISVFKNIKVCGLMAVLPVSGAESCCVKMNALFERCKTGCPGAEMEYLSMGMSDDFETAIENGANMVRLGRALFGGRK